MSRGLLACALVVAAGLMVTPTSRADIRSGAFSIGGSFGFQVSSEDEVRTTQLWFSPAALYFFTDKLAGGGSLNVTVQMREDYTSRGVGGGPRVRYYFTSYPYALFLSAEYAFLHTRDDFGSDDDVWRTRNRHFAAAGCGISVFISKDVAVEPMMAVYRTRSKRTDNLAADKTTETTGMSGTVGVSVFIGR